MKLLLLEDEPQLRKNIARYFTLKGYEVVSCEDGAKVLDQPLEDFDLLILDINTPDISGFEVVEYLKSSDIRVPVIFISAMTKTETVLEAFGLGCGDYVRKPFELAELEARVGRLLNASGTADLLEFKESYRYDLENRILSHEGMVIPLSSNHKRILHLLIKHRGTLVTFSMLNDYVWEGKEISMNTITSHIRNLRKQLPDGMIQNVKGEGYIVNV